eukprot:1161201-Pelagomonas_calceolata.AAC.9
MCGAHRRHIQIVWSSCGWSGWRLSSKQLRKHAVSVQHTDRRWQSGTPSCRWVAWNETKEMRRWCGSWAWIGVAACLDSRPCGV